MVSIAAQVWFAGLRVCYGIKCSIQYLEDYHALLPLLTGIFVPATWSALNLLRARHRGDLMSLVFGL